SPELSSSSLENESRPDRATPHLRFVVVACPAECYEEKTGHGSAANGRRSAAGCTYPGRRCGRVRSTGGEVHPASLRPRLQHDFESRGHERPAPGYFFQSLQIHPRFPREILFLHLDPFHRGEHDAEFFKETRPPFSPQPRRCGREHSKRQRISRAHPNQQSCAGGRPVRAPAKIERGHDETV